MITLETERLKLIPLTLEQAEMFTHLDSRLEDSLGLERAERELTLQYRDAIRKYTLNWMKEDPDNYLFSTIWVIAEKQSNTICGDIGFKRKADSNGYIEIGYSTQPRFRVQGYITEAIGQMVEWAFTHPEVKAVIAETREDNIASIKALKKNGFYEFKHTKTPEPAHLASMMSDVKMLWHIRERD
ncbi:MAG: GNAT family N-acetyltransferase [Ignavibacteria bacterium]|nr:GNAT family N-acetyltransferase [Ignavibacteria bacterium]